MTAHEQELFLGKLSDTIVKAVNSRRSLWTPKAIVSTVTALLIAGAGAAGGTAYIGTRQSTVDADADQAQTMAGQVRNANRDYIMRIDFQDAQVAQDRVFDAAIQTLTERMDRVQSTAENTNMLIQRMAGKMEVKVTP
jgi:hypothetical protein